MDNTKLLQDITYYTRIIREKTKQNQKQYITNLYKPKYSNSYAWKPKVNINTNYKYVKQKAPPPVEAPKPESSSSSVTRLKVLINPHFRSKNVHINPNFTKNFIQLDKPQPAKTTVHINPKVLNCEQHIDILHQKPVIDVAIINDSSQVNKISNNVINLDANQFKKPKEKYLTKTNYKIVKKNTTNPSYSFSSKRASPSFKTKYKLDRRNYTIRKRKYSLTLKKTPVRISKTCISRNPSMCTNLKKIDGTLYQTSRNKLQKSDNLVQRKLLKKVADKRNRKLITNRSFRYVKETEVKLPANRGKRLRRVSVIHSSKYKFVKNKDSSPATRSKLRLIRCKKIVKLPNKFRKNNVPCPIYCRYGKCSSYDKGTCRRLHDPKLINICKKFLQGACDIKNCNLSHNVSLEKMPTCKFYLDGFCSKDNCPYLHVKLSESVDICKNFIQGYCAAAEKCDKRHVFFCPEFERDGKCTKTKCPYPHTKLIGKKSTNILLENTKTELNPDVKESMITAENISTLNKNEKTTNSSGFCIDNDKISEPSTTTTNLTSCRYYIKNVSNEGEDEVDKTDTVTVPKVSFNETCPDFIPFS